MATIPPDDFYARINKTLAGAGAFITDRRGRVLLVKPNYRDHWLWPGGHVDEGETPADACAREVREELGLILPVGRLLGVHWVPPLGDRPLPLVHFLFDCGTLPSEDGIVLQREELDAYRFVAPGEAREVMPAYLVRRLRAAIAARTGGTSFYLTGGSAGFLAPGEPE
ncbi:ADP-ribose pyrophosphatase [Sphaerisporangium rufum]|uniref:ADP-ribose pyrophosphatase n=1 Tax=Sphaerisporangium rufum TaxID=1381558 RepID=A0A919V7T8_9ACTN|nr:NUDIX hydrolase [Sphaerisporangium rufum]GII80715.1 ADP-ribose pyrophosphatase [Sphaerisporangium rufum]